MVEVLDRISRTLNRMLVFAAGGCLAAMVVLTCANIVLRLFSVPIQGTFELMGLLGAVVAAFPLGFTRIRRGHIAVDVLVHSFSRPVQRRLEAFNSAICAVFFSVVSRQIAGWSLTLRRTGEVTETLRIIFYPFTLAVSLGCLLLALVCVVDLLKAVFHDKKAQQ